VVGCDTVGACAIWISGLGDLELIFAVVVEIGIGDEADALVLAAYGVVIGVDSGTFSGGTG